MQTLVLAVQNAVPPRDMGVATASSTFFRQMGATAGTAIFLSVLFSTVGDKIASAFKARRDAPSASRRRCTIPRCCTTRRTSRCWTCSSTPAAALLRVLSDSSFIQHLDPRLAEPFKRGFADSMHTVFLMGAIVVALAFLLMLFIKEVPLRQISGLQARAQADAEAESAKDAAAAVDGAAHGADAEGADPRTAAEPPMSRSPTPRRSSPRSPRAPRTAEPVRPVR